MNKKVNLLTLCGILTSFSIVMEFINTPLFPPPADFLRYSPGDVPLVLITYLFGPFYGLIALGINSIIFAFSHPAGNGFYGLIMHFLASGAYLCLFYFLARKRNLFWIISGLALGTVGRVLIMIPANLIVTPFFLKYPVEAVKALIIPVIIPFNILHSGINSVIFVPLFISLKQYINKILRK